MRYKLESRRGRPNGRYRSQTDIRLLEYLARVSMKHGIDSDKLSNSFLDASQHQKSECGNLSIECRVRERDFTVFLITRNQEVVGQFRMSKHLLSGKPNLLNDFTSKLSTIGTLAQQAKSDSYKIEDLRAGMKHLKIKAKVLEVSQPTQIATRFGFHTNVVNALIADETGIIKLSLLGSQIKVVSVHDIVEIENAHVSWFRGERQLRIGKHGRISVVQGPRDA